MEDELNIIEIQWLRSLVHTALLNSQIGSPAYIDRLTTETEFYEGMLAKFDRIETKLIGGSDNE